MESKPHAMILVDTNPYGRPRYDTGKEGAGTKSAAATRPALVAHLLGDEVYLPSEV